MWKLRERNINKELTKDGFTKYNYEKSKERTERIIKENEKLFLGLKEHFKDQSGLQLRSRKKNFEIQVPINFKSRNENDRLKSMEKVSYDSEGFNMSFYSKYKFREDAVPSKVIDKNQKFGVSMKSKFDSFDKMRVSLENKTLTHHCFLSAK